MFYNALLRGGENVLPEDFDLADPATEGILKRIGKGTLGLLGTAGRALDYPARLIRRGITGLEEPTGRDVLKSLGIDIGPNKPGLDWGDVASFSTEMVADPLSYLGGVGALTKLGTAAKALPRATQALSTAKHALSVAEAAGDIERAARIAPMVERYAADVARLGETAPLAKTWGAQAAAGQRQAFDIGIPFTRLRKSIPATGTAGQAFVGGLGTLGRGIAETRPAKWLAERFGTPSGLEATAGARGVSEELKRMAPITAAERIKTGEAEIAAIAERLGKTPEEVATELYKPVEKPWPQFDVPLGPEFKEQEPAISALAQTIRTREPLQLKTEQMAGLPTSELSDEGLAYLRRLRSAEGAQYQAGLAGGKLTSPFATLKEHPTTFGAQIQREEAFAGKTVPELNKLIKEKGGPQKFFVEHPVVASAVRGMEGDKAMAEAVLGKGLIKEFAKPDAVGPTVGEFLEKSRLLPTGEDLTLRVPQEVADEFLKLRDFVTNPEKISTVQKVAEGIRHYVSQSLLVSFPSFHSRNLTTNIANTSIAGLFHPLDYARDWITAAKNILKGTEQAKEWDRMGLLGGGFAREFSPEAFQGRIRELTQTGKPGLLEKLKLPSSTPGIGGLFRTGQKVGETIEGASRVAHYLAGRRAGMDHMSALASVDHYLFNYSKLTKFEKEKIRPYVMFYTWNSRQLKMLFQALPEKTGELATISRLTTQPSTERGPMPTWLRSTTALPAGKDVEGNALYLSGMGSPLEVLQNLDFINYSIPERIGSILNPAYRVPIELLAGKDLRMNMPIEEMTKSYRGWPYNILPGYKESTTPRGFPRTTANPYWLYALRSSPFSRFATEAGQAQDPTKDILSRFLNVTTGAKISSVDESAERKRQAIAAIEARLKALAGEGRAKLFKSFFPVGEVKDPEVKALIRLEARIRKT